MLTEHKLNMRVARADAKVAVIQAKAGRIHAQAEVVAAQAKLAEAKRIAKAAQPATVAKPAKVSTGRRKWVVGTLIGLALIGYANRPAVDASATVPAAPAHSVSVGH